jgi:hypothetical protein
MDPESRCGVGPPIVDPLRGYPTMSGDALLLPTHSRMPEDDEAVPAASRHQLDFLKLASLGSRSGLLAVHFQRFVQGVTKIVQ